MPDFLGETVAHRAGFKVSTGNWITPDGSLILGENSSSHHWETLKKYCSLEESDYNLTVMNCKVAEGFIRLVFRNDVLFQVAGIKMKVIWQESPNYTKMRRIMSCIPDVEVHIFSKNFYIVGESRHILSKDLRYVETQTSD